MNKTLLISAIFLIITMLLSGCINRTMENTDSNENHQTQTSDLFDKFELLDRIDSYDGPGYTIDGIATVIYKNSSLYIEYQTGPSSLVDFESWTMKTQANTLGVVIPYFESIQSNLSGIIFNEIHECHEKYGCNGATYNIYLTNLTYDDAVKLSTLEMTVSEWLSKTKIIQKNSLSD